MNNNHSTTTWGPLRDDGLPSFVTWQGEDYTTPDFEELNRMVFASVVDTLDEQSIEPDGVAYNGCPSWLLALELI